MQKGLLILLLLTLLIYIIYRRVVKKGGSTSVLKSNKQGFHLLQAESRLLRKTIRNTLISAGVGLGLFIVVILLAMKIKILLFLVPISLYLMGQLLLLNNQLKYVKDQRIWYQAQTHTVWVEWLNGESHQFDLLTDVQQVKRVQAVQKNKQILFGYYEISLHAGSIHIPLLLADSTANALFFDTLEQHYTVSQKTTMFPLI